MTLDAHLPHRFRAGRGRSAAGEPDALQPVLSGEARLLPRELRHVYVRRRRDAAPTTRQPGSVLQPAHRAERRRHADSDRRRRARVGPGRSLRRRRARDEDRALRARRRRTPTWSGASNAISSAPPGSAPSSPTGSRRVAGDYNRVYGPTCTCSLRQARGRLVPAAKRHAGQAGKNLARSCHDRRGATTSSTLAAEYNAVQAEFQSRGRIRAARQHGAVQRRGGLASAAAEEQDDSQSQFRHQRRLLQGRQRQDRDAHAGGDRRDRFREQRLHQLRHDQRHSTGWCGHFAIRSNVAIPVGDYDYRSYTLKFNSGSQAQGESERHDRVGRVLERRQRDR